MRIHIVIAIVLALVSSLFSQRYSGAQGGEIRGRVYDDVNDIPVEYANVVLFKSRDSTQVTGTVSNDQGRFQVAGVRPGSYFVEIYFIGYERARIADVRVNSTNPLADLGTIALKPTILNLETVEVGAERAPISYQIDKKVINVSQQNTAISGTAVDVLENVPSVNVDIEGNVSLRGSGNFVVLVDGRPTILDPSDALQQIPATTIENIEIVTNPSAKYDPEGTSGIINIIMKKNRRTGRSGIANINAGIDDKYGGDLLFDYKNSWYKATIGVDYNRRFYPGTQRDENRTTQNGLTSFVFSNGDARRGRISVGLRGELALDLSTRDLFTIGGRWGDRSHESDTDLNYDEWAEPNNEHVLYTSVGERERSGIFYELHSSLIHRLAPKGHEISGEADFSYRNSDEFTLSELIKDGLIDNGQRSTETGPSREFRAKLDYTRSFGELSKFEAGYQSEFDWSDETTELLEYSATVDDYVLDPRFSNNTRYDRNVHALYALYAGEWRRLGYQLGLRGEYTDRFISFDGAEEDFTIDRWDYFPTLHTSFQLSEGQQAMASYARRIERPRGWNLEPFQTWIDAYNVRVGNPALKPEYIDSFEMGYQTHFGKSLVSAEAYYRIANNKIERVRSVYAENVTLHSVANIGQDYSLGTELLVNVDISKKWNVNLMGNFYDYRITGNLANTSFDRESFNWRTRMSHSIKLRPGMQLQIDGIYNSPSVSSQGRREGFVMANAAFKVEFFRRLLSATLQVRDVFDTAKFEFTSEGQDFYDYTYRTHQSPVVMLNLRYNFNNYRSERRREDSGGEQNVGGGEDDF